MEAERKGTLPGCSEACGANSFADASEEADLSREIFYAEAHPFFEARLQRSLSKRDPLARGASIIILF